MWPDVLCVFPYDLEAHFENCIEGGQPLLLSGGLRMVAPKHLLDSV